MAQPKQKPEPIDVKELVAQCMEDCEWNAHAAAVAVVDAAWTDDDALAELAIKGAHHMARDLIRGSRSQCAPGQAQVPQPGPGGDAGRFGAALSGWRAWRIDGGALLAHATAEDLERNAHDLEAKAKGLKRNASFYRAILKEMKRKKVATPGELGTATMDRLYAKHEESKS